MASLDLESLDEMRNRARAWLVESPAEGPPTTRANAINEQQMALDVLDLLKALEDEQEERAKVADSRLDLIFRIHQVAEEYAGPRPIDAQPEHDLEAIENAIAGAESERDECRREGDELRAALERIAKHPHNAYDCAGSVHARASHSPDDAVRAAGRMYEVGAADGHRCAAEIAIRALKDSKPTKEAPMGAALNASAPSTPRR